MPQTTTRVRFEEWDFSVFQKEFPEMLDVDVNEFNVQHVSEKEFSEMLDYALKNGTEADYLIYSEENTGGHATGRAMVTTVILPQYERKRFFYTAFKAKELPAS